MGVALLRLIHGGIATGQNQNHKIMKKETKTYSLLWMSLLEGKTNLRERIATDNPKMALFNFACRMLVTANSLFGTLPVETIIKNIKEGKGGREHYWLEYPNSEVLAITETPNA